MQVTKLLISPVKKRIFCPKTTKFGPKLALLVNLGQAMQAYSVPCWWVVWWLWRAGCISQDTYLLYCTAPGCQNYLDLDLSSRSQYPVLSKPCRARSRLKTSNQPLIIQLESTSTNSHSLLVECLTQAFQVDILKLKFRQDLKLKCGLDLEAEVWLTF